MSRKKKPSTPPMTSIETLLSLVPSDLIEVPTLPELDGKSPLEAAKAMAAYHRGIAEQYQHENVERRIRTRVMIILGAIVDGHGSPTLQAAVRDLVHDHAAPRDLVALLEVLTWLKKPTQA
jgi:hypothetical protein